MQAEGKLNRTGSCTAVNGFVNAPIVAEQAGALISAEKNSANQWGPHAAALIGGASQHRSAHIGSPADRRFRKSSADHTLTTIGANQ
jgi:hypothetical protein